MKILKWFGITAGLLLLLVVSLTASAFLISEKHRNTTYTVSTPELTYDLNDAELLERGRHVATIRQCIDCHGQNLEGKISFEDKLTGLVVATNLTTGEGGVGSYYNDADLIRAIRNGIDHNGKLISFMPSDEYTGIDKDDLTALVAYIRNAEPIDNVLPKSRIGLPARIGHLLIPGIELFPARLIDQTKPVPEPVAERTPMELGAYLATSCSGCHGRNLSGGPIAGVPPDWPAASNITPKGAIGKWTEKEFTKAMRKGITPDGHQMENRYMPWKVFGQMTDEELHGLFVYLRSLPELEMGSD